MTELFQAHYGPRNQIVHVYDSFSNLRANPRLASNGDLQVTTFPAEARAKRQAIVVRVASDAKVSVKSGGAGTQSAAISTMSATNYVGESLGLMADGTPAYMGATLTPMEIAALQANGGAVSFSTLTFTQPSQANSYGQGVSTMSIGGGGTQIELAAGIIPLAVIILLSIIAVGIAGTFITKNIANAESERAKQEEANMRRAAIDDVAESTQIDAQWDAGGYHFIKYKNGTIIKTDPNGKVTTEIQGTTPEDIYKGISTTMPGQIDWNTILMYAVVGVIIIGGVAVAVKYAYPYAKRHYPEWKASVKKAV